MYADGFLRSAHSVIRNPVDPERLLPEKTREEVRSAWGVGPDSKVLLSVGRFVPAKGQIHLMDALPLLKEKFPGIKLVMAGSGPLESQIRKRASELNVEDRVIWTGFSSSVPDLFQGADAVVFPSLWEGMGLVPLEAILRSRPVALSDLPALKEFVEPGPAAEYFSPGRGTEIAEGVIRLLERPEMEVTMDLLGRLPDLLGRFSSVTIAGEYLELYRTLTGGER
jgi:glycogen(starch) synthase